MREELCKICGSPRSLDGSGSLTQWLSRCRCSQSGSTGDQTEQHSVCRTCGKRQARGRSGSLTQFIFRFDLCTCQAPSGTRSGDPRGPRMAGLSEAGAEALDLPADSFPFGRYRPLQLLGSGASGEVYKAFDPLLKKFVAVKVLRTLTAAQMVSFQEEARATSTLNHPGIVRLLDFGVTPGGTPYMVLDFIDGTVLSGYLEENAPLKWTECCDIAVKLCEALSYAHDHRVLHRDIQPGNVILSRDAGALSVHLIDFGLAKIIQDQQSWRELPEGSQTLAGTPFYMSADTARGLPYDRRSEVYSLGCLIFEMLAGRPPFIGGSPLETLARHAEEMPPALADLIGSDIVPGWLQNVVEKCLAKEPGDRYETMESLAAALRIAEGEVGTDRENVKTVSGSSRARLDFPFKHSVIAVALIAVAGFYATVGLREGSAPVPEREVEKTASELNPSALDGCYDPVARKLDGRMLVDDENSVELGKFKDAIEIDLSMCEVTDKVFARIDSPRLRILRLADTNVSSLGNIERIESLEELYLGNTAVGNQSLRRLARLPSLHCLDLCRTEIDGGAIGDLLELDGLASLDLRHTALTEQEVGEIARRMPACSVNFNEQSAIPISQQKLAELTARGRYREVIEQTARFIEMIEKEQGKDATILAFLCCIHGQNCLLDGRLDAARASLDRAIAIGERRGERVWIVPALLSRCSLASREKNQVDLVRFARELCRATEKRYGESPELCAQETHLADVLTTHGNFEEGRVHYEKAVAIGAGIEAPAPALVRSLSWSAQQLYRFYRAEKNFPEAERHSRLAVGYWQRLSGQEAASNAGLISDAYSILATSLIDGGKLEEAIRAQETSVDIARSHNLESLEKQLGKLARMKKARP